MLAAVVALLLAPVSYGIGPATKLNYDMTIGFDGFIPVFGGQQGAVEVRMGVRVDGMAEKDGSLRAASDITSFNIKFNDQPLGIGLETVKDVFPRNTIEFTPQGKVLKTDAPDKALPIRLPGLDVKRFPDITYLPVVFPTDAVDVGTTWEFKRAFGESDVAYKCKALEVSEDTVKLAVSVSQEYELLENAGLTVVKNEKDAVARVKTSMTGSGTVLFDRKRGIALVVKVKSKAVSVVKQLSSGKTSNRTLTTDLVFKLHGYDAKPAVKPSTTTQNVASTGSWWDRTKSWASGAAATGQKLWRNRSLYLGMAKTLVGIVAATMPVKMDGLTKALMDAMRSLSSG